MNVLQGWEKRDPDKDVRLFVSCVHAQRCQRRVRGEGGGMGEAKRGKGRGRGRGGRVHNIHLRTEMGAPLLEQNERYRFFCLTMAVLIVLMITCITYRLHCGTACRGWAGRYKWIVWCSNNNENNSNKHLKRFASE